MLAQDSDHCRRSPLRSLGAALVETFIGANRWSLAAKTAGERTGAELLQLFIGRKKGGRGKTVSNADRLAIETLRQARKHRRLSVRESELLFQLSRSRPHADIQLYFTPGATEISPAAEAALAPIGEALSHIDLHGKAFLIAGHTDRTGGVEHSIELSMARAEAIKRYLVENFRIDADALLPHGYGFRYLKTPRKPFAHENHRFEIVNLSD